MRSGCHCWPWDGFLAPICSAIRASTAADRCLKPMPFSAIAATYATSALPIFARPSRIAHASLVTMPRPTIQHQTFTPACSSCHVEHRGAVRLAATADSGCTQCHADLKSKDGVIRFDRSISGFDRHHPEFAAVRSGRDPGTMNLNHFVHLQPTLRGPQGAVQMKCDDCHRPLNVDEPWPYSVAVVQPATQQPVLVGATETSREKTS